MTLVSVPASSSAAFERRRSSGDSEACTAEGMTIIPRARHPTVMTPISRSFRYKAFLSYSHATDGKLAPALKVALERFAKPWYPCVRSAYSTTRPGSR